MAAIPHVAIGIFIAVIWLVTFVIMFLSLIWNLNLRRLWNARRFRNLDSRSPSPSREKDKTKVERGSFDKKEISPEGNGAPVRIPPHTSEALLLSTTLTETSHGSEIPSRFTEHQSTPHGKRNSPASL